MDTRISNKGVLLEGPCRCMKRKENEWRLFAWLRQRKVLEYAGKMVREDKRERAMSRGGHRGKGREEGIDTITRRHKGSYTELKPLPHRKKIRTIHKSENLFRLEGSSVIADLSPDIYGSYGMMHSSTPSI